MSGTASGQCVSATRSITTACGTASHFPFAHAIRPLSIFGHTAQCAAGTTIFFGNVLYQAIIVVLFDGKVNDHGMGKYFRGKKITRPMNSFLESRGSVLCSE